MDAMRFLRAHWTTIQKNPFDVYHYTAFAPLSSIFQQVYAKSSSFPHSVASIGPDPHWPSGSVIQPHEIETQALSPCGNWLATGGSSSNRPVFAVWDMQTADGTTTSHPCSNSECSIHNITFEQCGDILELRTRCKCDKVCTWDITTEPYVLLYEAQLESSAQWQCWADNYTKAISEQKTDSNQSRFFLSIFIGGIKVGSFDLGKAVEELVRWKFSPGRGDKIVGWSDKTIAIWEYSLVGCRLNALYSASDYSNFSQVLISPDTTSILYTYKESFPIGGVGLLSSKCGASIWSYEINNIRHAEFFPDGDRVLILADSNLHVIRSSDGVHMKKEVEEIMPFRFSISPSGEKIAAFYSSGVGVIDCETLSQLQWHAWTKPMDTGFADISWKNFTLVTITQFDHASQPITFSPLSPSEDPGQLNNSPDMKPRVEELFISPYGHHLFITFRDGSVQLWCNRSGAKIVLTGDCIEVGWESEIEYTSDSSTVGIWKDFSRECLTTVDTASGRTKRLPLPSSQIKKATLSPSSNHLITIDWVDSVNIISFDGVLLQSLGKISRGLSDIDDLVSSPTELSIAFTACRNGEDVVSVFNYGMEPAHCHFRSFDCGLIDAKFSPNGSHLFTMMESYTSSGLEIWMIKISNPMQMSIIGFRDWEDLEIFIPMKTITSGYRSFLKLSSLSYDPMTACSVDCSDGRMITTPMLCKFNSRVYYGWYTLPAIRTRLCAFSDHSVAYIDDRQQTFVIDYSKFIERM
jgi:hypothetical protein